MPLRSHGDTFSIFLHGSDLNYTHLTFCFVLALCTSSDGLRGGRGALVGLWPRDGRATPHQSESSALLFLEFPMPQNGKAGIIPNEDHPNT